MKKADPASRTVCKDGPAAGAKDPRPDNPTISRVMTCQNVTMTQFAAELQYYALDYIKTPVLRTRLTHIQICRRCTQIYRGSISIP
jgi:hypothetical protein